MSTTLKELTADDLAQLADRYTRISTRLFEFRLTHALSPEEERLVRVEGEQRLDALANVLRGQAIALTVKDAGLKADALREALESAYGTLEKLSKVRDVIGLVTNLVTLGGAVLSGNGGAIVKALRAFRSKGKDENEESEESQESQEQDGDGEGS
ncbi:hypothetical protein GJV26_28725 [Massilia dura]|uniref:Uncharacterized protein n=1 Tax=Pseudoduganella dura TaxID=321982 RepID=A0A6I3XRI5_9BURK|nr:hypothetical protein [Pseudoduganella dura]MUI16411.1 hypothetical protein [Pseudoduganella dura]GGX86564.1 hypothetical protein GCM10007386_16780 [Pseudoduganella dura]